MDLKYVDIHCHLDFKDYDEDREALLARMREQGVGAITIGTDLESSKRAVEIAENNENVWACVGIHPNSSELWDLNYELWEELVQSPKVVGIGECGLDYFRDKDEVRQKELFIKQIEFAQKHDKPLMLHCRNAYDEVLEILERYPGVRGNSHFFAGSVEQARRFVDIGFTCSFTGVITFTHDYDDVIKSLPTDMIMSETDAPFVSPVPYRGKRNEPSFVTGVVKKLAEIKGLDETVALDILLANARRVFVLP